MIKKLIAIVGTLGMAGGLGLTATAASAATVHHGFGDRVRIVCSNPDHPGLITFLNSYGYQVTESSSNTAQYLTAAYLAKVAKGGSFAKHAVTVLVPAVTNGVTTCIGVTYRDGRWGHWFDGRGRG
jgi:hypothetical protein